MSEKDFLASRIAKLSAKPPSETKSEPEEAKPKPEQSPEEKPKESTPAAEKPEEKKPAVNPKEVLSKDVEDLTDEEIAELAQKGKSGLLKRIAELTAKRKIAEERAAALEAAMRQTQSQQLPEPKVENNPYASYDNVEKLQTEKKELDAFIEWAEDVLFKTEDMGANDIAAVADGKEYTKASIRESLRGARKRRDRYLPAQFAELQARQQRTAAEQAFRQQARKELSWMEGEDNDTRRNFEAMVKDPRLAKLKEMVPELAPQVEYLVAHAANSMFGRRTIESYASNETKASTPSLTPPENPATTASAPSRHEAREEKKESELRDRVAKTGKPQDWIALRATQISKRKKL